jgi:uncharacterized membrane protein YbhN (UPF0104 family)
MMQKSISSQKTLIVQIIRWAVSLLAIGLVIYLLLNNWSAISQSMLEIGWTRFLLLIGLILISRLLMILRWHLILRSVGEDISYLASLRVTYAGFFANNFMPSTIGGDVFRLTAAVIEKIDSGVAAASLVMDRIVGMIGMALILPIGIARLLAYNGSFDTQTLQPSTTLAVSFFHKLKTNQGKVITWLRHTWQKLWGTITLWVRKPWSLIPSLLTTLAHQTCLYLFIWLILDSFGETMSFWLIGGLWSIVYFVTLVPVSISGLGVQEVVIIFAFQTLGSTSESAAVTLALLFRAVMLLVSLPGVVAFLSLLPKTSKTKEEDPST